jgi:hypothetical protein
MKEKRGTICPSFLNKGEIQHFIRKHYPCRDEPFGRLLNRRCACRPAHVDGEEPCWPFVIIPGKGNTNVRPLNHNSVAEPQAVAVTHKITLPVIATQVESGRSPGKDRCLRLGLTLAAGLCDPVVHLINCLLDRFYAVSEFLGGVVGRYFCRRSLRRHLQLGKEVCITAQAGLHVLRIPLNDDAAFLSRTVVAIGRKRWLQSRLVAPGKNGCRFAL